MAIPGAGEDVEEWEHSGIVGECTWFAALESRLALSPRVKRRFLVSLNLIPLLSVYLTERKTGAHAKPARECL